MAVILYFAHNIQCLNTFDETTMPDIPENPVIDKQQNTESACFF